MFQVAPVFKFLMNNVNHVWSFQLNVHNSWGTFFDNDKMIVFWIVFKLCPVVSADPKEERFMTYIGFSSSRRQLFLFHRMLCRTEQSTQLHTSSKEPTYAWSCSVTSHWINLLADSLTEVTCRIYRRWLLLSWTRNIGHLRWQRKSLTNQNAPTEVTARHLPLLSWGLRFL